MLWVHLFATLTLVGLIWTIQLVHYPLMALVEQGFVRYEAEHQRRITWLVTPLMGAEGVSTALLTLEPPSGVDPAIAWLGAGLLAVIWAATAFVAMPLHSRLGSGHDVAVVERLVATNWIRTIAWTARGVIATWMVVAITA